MNKKVPQEIDFKTIQKISSFSDLILIISAFLSILILLIDNWSSLQIGKNDSLLNLLNSLLAIASVCFFLIDILQNYFFQKAEDKRRTDFIDNSLGTILADENSIGYFSNDEIAQGFYKMGINCFENSFFTKEISAKMKLMMFLKSILIILLFIGIALFTTQKIFAAVLQITLPFTLLQQSIKLALFNARVGQVFDNFKMAFSAIDKKNIEKVIIHYVLKYETTLAWGGILISSKIFRKLNPKLTIEWNELKKKYIIS